MSLLKKTTFVWAVFQTTFRKFISVVLGATFMSYSLFAEAPSTPPASEPDGSELAKQIREMVPVGDSTIRGTLQIRLKKKRQSLPFICQVVRHGAEWETIFTASSTTNTPAETLVIKHAPGETNSYLYAKAQTPTGALPVLSPVSPQFASTTQFAGSDFTLADLGLDYLFWPMQKRLKNQNRLDRLCYVLESSNDRGAEIVRMCSFIDKEYSGNLGEQGFPALLVAEAYDSNGELVRKFSLHGSSFKKVNGQYRLRKMEILNEKTGSQTTIEYDLKE